MISSVQKYYPQLPYFGIPELAWSPARSRERPDFSLEEDVSNICRHWAGISTGRFNQDVSMMIEGPKGSGKSFTGLTLCINSAKWEAEYLGDDWRDHFDIERTAAIVDTEKADDVMINSRKYDVRLFDDISLAWGARNWQSEENKDKNDIYIINRIDNTINVLTSPNSKLIDVVPRSNVNFKGEMDTPFFHFGFATLKVFKPIPVFRAATYKVLDPYLKHGRDKFVVYLVEAPPKRMVEAYDKEREKATTKVKDQRRAHLSEKRGELVPSVQPKEKQKRKNTKEMEERIGMYLQRWVDIRKNGGGDKEIAHDAKTFCKIPRDTWRYWKDCGILHKLGVLQDLKTS